MKPTAALTTLAGIVVALCPLANAAEPGCWTTKTHPQLKRDINTKSKVGQWTETFVNGVWGVGSWVKGNAAMADGKLLWKLHGPTITKTHPTVMFDTNADGFPDMLQTNYRGGQFTLYDAPGLWGNGAVFTCQDTLIEDNFCPFKKKYKYGFVTGVATNKALGLTCYIDSRVIQTSHVGTSHSGELTRMTLVLVPDKLRQAIDTRYPGAHIRRMSKKTKPLPHYEIGFVYQGKRMRAMVSPDGLLARVRSTVTQNETPKDFAQKIAAKFQGSEDLKIKKCENFATNKKGHWIRLKQPTVFFNATGTINGQEQTLLAKLPRPSQPKTQTQKFWRHNGTPAQPYSVQKALKKKANNILDNLSTSQPAEQGENKENPPTN